MSNSCASYLTDLHQPLDQYFDLAGIRAVCLKLSVAFASMPGDEKPSRILALAATAVGQRQVIGCARQSASCLGKQPSRTQRNLATGHHAAEANGSRISVALSLRSDFVSNCAKYSNLRELRKRNVSHELDIAQEEDQWTRARTRRTK